MTADILVGYVQDRAAVPPTSALTTTKILNYANEELFGYVVPIIKSLSEEYFTDVQDTALVAGQAAYATPPRAMALREVKYLDSTGNESLPIPRISLVDIGRYNPTAGNTPVAYYFTANQINLIPAPSAGTTGSLRVRYDRRPGTLVLNTIAANKSTAVGTVLTVSSTLITLTGNTNGWPANTRIDIANGSNPYGLKWKDIATTTASTGTATIVVATDMTAGVNAIVAGDVVTLAGTANTPQIPDDFSHLLILRTAARVGGVLQDVQLKNEALASAGEMAKEMRKLYSPRSPGNLQKISAWRN